MDIGLSVRFDDAYGYTLDELPARVTTIEERGFASIWYPDHSLTFAQYSPEFPYHYTADGVPPIDTYLPWHDCQLILTAMAAITSTIRLGQSVLVVPQRNPLLAAKEITTLDHLSHGRLNVGVGVGWSGDEFAALNVPFKGRGARADEYLEVMMKLWEGEVTKHEGDLVNFDGVIMRPTPYQRPHPPIYVGGESAPALRRTAKYGDGWISGLISSDELKTTIGRLRTACEAIDRDPDEIKISFLHMYKGQSIFEQEMLAAERLGIDEMIVVIRSNRIGNPEPDDTLDEIIAVSGVGQN